jgi:hypothetical protein
LWEGTGRVEALWPAPGIDEAAGSAGGLVPVIAEVG